MHSLFIEKFKVPEVAVDYLEVFFKPSEIDFVEKIDKDIFDENDIVNVTGDKEFVKKAYSDGLINIVDKKQGLYCLNDFYEKLNVFCIVEQELYRSIDEEGRRKIEEWFFNSFYERLDPNEELPTKDRVYLLEEMLELIENDDRPVYLNYCDCRSMKGDCKLPTRTCITYENGINTRVDRGISEEIDKERAKQVVIDAHEAGLMHTANPNGICNCCGDCCYVLRSQQRRKSIGIWPPSKYVIEFNESKCVGCGKCAKRCHFGVFEIKEGKATVDESKCIGCGICNSTCKKNALTMKERK
ncbi:ATP-binding protein [Intestinibacter sp.]|uniref:ATP-binding protein n=1 Tax=Intestinibacter sp. TaxID=1965304 RepID=UPI003F1714FD